MSQFFNDAINNAILNQLDDTTTVPLSLRLPLSLSNELDELALTLDRSKSFLVTEFIKAGIKETNHILAQKSANPRITPTEEDDSNFRLPRTFMLNTNYSNDPKTHFDMLKNQEAAAFCAGWKEYIERLSEGDRVYLYQSGVGFIAVGEVSGELEKSEHYGVPDDKYAKKLRDFKIGFKAVSAKEFKSLSNESANFRRTMVELSSKQNYVLNNEIERRIKNKPDA
jgi:predicted DNA-binding protein